MLLVYTPEGEVKKEILRVLSEHGITYKDYGEVLLLKTDIDFLASLLDELGNNQDMVLDNLRFAYIEPEDMKSAISLVKKVFKAFTVKEFIEQYLYNNISDIMYSSKIFFHAIVSVKDQNIYAFEALCRTSFPIYKIMHLGGSVAQLMDEFCRYSAMREFSKRFLNKDYKIFLNFHPKFLQEPLKNLGDLVSVSLGYGLSPMRIVVEITEYEGMDFNSLKQLRSFLKKEGILVALDDVGEGYSGLYQFVELTPDIVKLDMKLVRDCHMHKIKRSVLSAIVEMCKSSGITVLAEGVEKKEELDVLLDIGVDLVQGFLIAKPEPNPNIEKIKDKVKTLIKN